MKILITGGLGRVGRPLVARLLGAGHEVCVVDRVAEGDCPGAEYYPCDITEYPRLRELVKGQNALIHLAAIPNPSQGLQEEIFRINTQGTFNLFQAAAEEGIERVVCASSINALGFSFGIKEFEIEYFPVDEEHPSFTTEGYSFSKEITEKIADYFWRRDGISSFSLRLSSVLGAENWKKKNGSPGNGLRDWLAMSPDKRREQYEVFRRKGLAFRALRAMELARLERKKRAEVLLDQSQVGLFFSHAVFWTCVHVEDAAQAFEKALLAEGQGSQALFINDSQNSAGLESEFLVQTFFPQVKARKRPLQGTESLVSIEKARRMIGFEPQYHLA